MESTRADKVSNLPQTAGARPPREIRKSHKLDNVCYEIRGPAMKEAERMEEEGHRILKLNIGNPAPFGFEAPGRDPGGRDPQPAQRPGLLRFQGALPGPQGHHAVLPAAGRPGVDIEDIYAGQRRLRADGDGACRRCSTTATKCCCRPPITRCGQQPSACRAARPCTTAATSRPTGSQTWTTSRRKVTPRTRALVDHQSQQPHRSRLPQGSTRRADRDCREPRSDPVLRRDLRQDPLRRRPSRHRWRRSPTIC